MPLNTEETHQKKSLKASRPPSKDHLSQARRKSREEILEEIEHETKDSYRNSKSMQKHTNSSRVVRNSNSVDNKKKELFVKGSRHNELFTNENEFNRNEYDEQSNESFSPDSFKKS